MRFGLRVPDEQSLAEAGAGGDERAVADGVRRAVMQGDDVVGGKLRDAVAVGFKIIDERDVLDVERGFRARGNRASQGRLVSLRRPSRTGPGQPKQAATISSLLFSGVREEGVDDVVQAREAGGRELYGRARVDEACRR